MFTLLAPIWQEGRAPGATGPGRWDWVLVAVIVTAALAEGYFREDIVWRTVTVLFPIAVAMTVPWRRVYPLHMLLVAFGANSVIRVYALLIGVDWVAGYATVFLLLLLFALTRWGSGREGILGLAFVSFTFAVTIAVDRPPAGEIIGGALFMLFPPALGMTARFQDMGRRKTQDQLRLREREQLARELHDTVAHHVSAIAVQAQAGKTLAATDPDAPLRALEVIEGAASKTLNEMRGIVRSMRDDDDPEFSPSRSIEDIRHLGRQFAYPIDVRIEIRGDLDGIDAALASTLYRLTQESITNAVRHAQRAKELRVTIEGRPKHVHLRAEDDGERIFRAPPPGLGLRGMSERVAILGGSMSAGPGTPRGWIVEATLPREDPRT